MLDRLVEVVEANKKKRKTSGAEYVDWVAVCKTMGSEYPDQYNSKERWRSAYRRKTSTKWLNQHNKSNKVVYYKNAGITKFQQQLAVYFKRRRTFVATQEMFQKTEDELYSEITRMRLRGYNIEVWLQDGNVMIHMIKKPKTTDRAIKKLYEGFEFKIALVSDTHMGSDKEALDELKEFYRYAHSKGIVDFYHAGDITDGYYTNRNDSIYEQTHIGFDRQLEHVVESYPKIEGVTTYFITGNHDVTHVRNGGANIGKAIGNYRDDLVYLGHNFAKVWLSEGVDLNLIHPGDGSAYGVSLKAQKIVDAATGKRRAAIMAIGHYHKMNWNLWKGVHTFIMPSFQHQTTFMETKNLKSYVGGYILTIKVDKNGNLISLTPEYVDYTE